jgi:hypothetical protein
MNEPLPWPTGAVEPYQAIKEHVSVLEAALTTALEEGASQENFHLIRALNETLGRRAKEIRRQCNAIAKLLPDERRSGRYPKWYTTTTDIWGEADKLIDIAKEIRGALQAKELIYIRTLLGLALKARAKIDTLLEQSPKLPKSDVLEQVKRVVNEPPDSSEWYIKDIMKRLDQLSGKEE